MTIQETLTAAAGQVTIDAALFHDFIHGGAADTFETEAGTQKSLLGRIADVEQSFNQANLLADVAALKTEAQDWATKAENVPVTSGVGGDEFSARHWAAKAEASALILTYQPFGFRREGRDLIVESGGDTFDGSLYLASILLPGSTSFSINYETGYLEAEHQL